MFPSTATSDIISFSCVWVSEERVQRYSFVMVELYERLSWIYGGNYNSWTWMSLLTIVGSDFYLILWVQVLGWRIENNIRFRLLIIEHDNSIGNKAVERCKKAHNSHIYGDRSHQEWNIVSILFNREECHCEGDSITTF